MESNVGMQWDDIRVGYQWADLFEETPTYVWDADGGSGDRDWSTAANWVADTEPTIANEAYIGGSYTAEVYEKTTLV